MRSIQGIILLIHQEISSYISSIFRFFELYTCYPSSNETNPSFNSSTDESDDDFAASNFTNLVMEVKYSNRSRDEISDVGDSVTVGQDTSRPHICGTKLRLSYRYARDYILIANTLVNNIILNLIRF